MKVKAYSSTLLVSSLLTAAVGLSSALACKPLDERSSVVKDVSVQTSVGVDAKEGLTCFDTKIGSDFNTIMLAAINFCNAQVGKFDNINQGEKRVAEFDVNGQGFRFEGGSTAGRWSLGGSNCIKIIQGIARDCKQNQGGYYTNTNSWWQITRFR